MPITIDMDKLKNERNNLYNFLKSKIQAPITIKDKALTVDSTEEMLLPRDVKAYVKRFLHHRGLSESYRVTEEHEVIRITRRKYREVKKTEERTAPSPYDTLPYYFPKRP